MRGHQPQERSFDEPSVGVSSSERAEHIVVLVHGIRTMAFWQNQVRPSLVDEGFTVELTNYGRFDLLQFLLPVCWLRNRPITMVRSQLQQVTRHYPESRISFIAHSFGTKIVAEILRRKPQFSANRVIFCGSVVPFQYPFEHFDDRFVRPILNDVGNHDYWPALAASITWGYGWTGTYGFRRPPFEDRIHDGFGHSDFLKPDFCRSYWVPFLRDGTIIPSARKPRSPDEAVPWRIRVILFVGGALKYMMCGLLVLLLLFCAKWALQERPRTAHIPVEAGSYNHAGPMALRPAVTAIGRQRCSIWMDWWLVEWLRGRRCVALGDVDNEIDEMIICRKFDHESRDPLDILEAFAKQFPNCLELDGIEEGRVDVNVPRRVPSLQASDGRRWRTCGCPASALEDLVSGD